MGLETVTYVPELNQSNPIGASDPKSEGDDHLRNIKKALLNTFGAFVGTAAAPKSVTLTEDQINDASQKAANETIAGDKTHTGFIRTDDSTAARAGFRIPTGVAPTAPAQGDIWVVAADIFARINGVTESLLSGAGGVEKFKSANESVTSSATIQDDDHLNGWSLVADKHYKIEGFLSYDQNLGDIKIRFNWSNTPVTEEWGFTAQDSLGSNVHDHVSNPTGQLPIVGLLDGLAIGLTVHGIFQANATTGGTVDFQWAQNSINANPTTVLEGSWIKISPLD